MAFQRAGDPKTVDVHIAIGTYWVPGIFSRHILNEALATLFASVENQTVFKTLLEPFFLAGALVVGHGTADVLIVDVLVCDSDVTHVLIPQYTQGPYQEDP